MCRKSGSNLFAVFTRASVVMSLQFITALSYVFYMSQNLKFRTQKNTDLAVYDMENWRLDFRCFFTHQNP